MARERFNDLKRITKALRDAKADISVLPQNLDFVKYWKWERGETVRPAIIRPNLGTSAKVGIIAFGLPSVDDDSKILVNMTGRSKTIFEGLTGKEFFGIEESTLTGYTENSLFKPALATLARKVAGSSQTSDITGRKYKKKADGSYSIPLGQTGTLKHYKSSVNAILAKKEITNLYYVSIKPENFARN